MRFIKGKLDIIYLIFIFIFGIIVLSDIKKDGVLN